jgi:hypothetical protein
VPVVSIGASAGGVTALQAFFETLLVKLRDRHPMRFRCRTGHAFTANSLLAQQSESTEAAIWNAMRALQESSMLLTHLAEHWKPYRVSIMRL